MFPLLYFAATLWGIRQHRGYTSEPASCQKSLDRAERGEETAASEGEIAMNREQEMKQ